MSVPTGGATDPRALIRDLIMEAGVAVHLEPTTHIYTMSGGFVRGVLQVLQETLAALSAPAVDPQMKEPDLITYMTTTDPKERDAMFLRTYAVRVLSGTESTWEIPNTRAATLRGIADRLVAAQQEEDMEQMAGLVQRRISDGTLTIGGQRFSQEQAVRIANDIVELIPGLAVDARPEARQESWLTPTTLCPDGEKHVLRCIRCEIPAGGQAVTRVTPEA